MHTAQGPLLHVGFEEGCEAGQLLLAFLTGSHLPGLLLPAKAQSRAGLLEVTGEVFHLAGGRTT